MGKTIFQPFLLEESYTALSCLKLHETFLNIKVLGKNLLWLLFVSKDLWGKELYMENTAKATLQFLRASVWKVNCFAHVRLPQEYCWEAVLLLKCFVWVFVCLGFLLLFISLGFYISVKSWIFLPFSEETCLVCGFNF